VQVYTHIIAPINADRTTYSLITLASIIPFPIVFATCTPKMKNAAKFQNAAQATAVFGDSTFVETTVAIEFAASFIPFRKSNVSAMTIIVTTRMVIMMS
jgi:hypothetical protein